MRVLVRGQEEYSPWQQVYSVLRRLPQGTCLVSDPDTRVGEFARKAASVDHLDWEEHDGSVDVEFAIIFWDPHSPFEREPTTADLLTGKVFTFEITPELYSEQAEWAVNYITLWREHVEAGGTFDAGGNGVSLSDTRPDGLD